MKWAFFERKNIFIGFHFGPMELPVFSSLSAYLSPRKGLRDLLF